jgi:RNA polymerase sigma-70 factor (ECF subfamily)
VVAGTTNSDGGPHQARWNEIRRAICPSDQTLMKQALSRAMSCFDESGCGESKDSALDFDRIVEFYRPRIFRFALASLRDRDAAETVAQDCFLRAHGAFHSFRGDCSMHTWLMGIAVNLIRDHMRSRRLQFWRRTRSAPLPPERIATSGSPVEHDSPEKLAVLRQQIESVWAAAEFLPDRQRTVFLLRFVEDMDILEIAAATGMKEGTVKTHMFRALQAVRRRIGPLGRKP